MATISHDNRQHYSIKVGGTYKPNTDSINFAMSDIFLHVSVICVMKCRLPPVPLLLKLNVIVTYAKLTVFTKHMPN